MPIVDLVSGRAAQDAVQQSKAGSKSRSAAVSCIPKRAVFQETERGSRRARQRRKHSARLCAHGGVGADDTDAPVCHRWSGGSDDDTRKYAAN